MGGQPTKLKKTSLESQEPEMLEKNSLDLIYIEDFFDDPRYLKALEKHNRKIKFEASKSMKAAARKTKSRLKIFEAMSDSFLGKKWKSKANNSSRSRSRSPKSKAPSRKATPSPKPVARPSTYSIRPTAATTSKSAGSVVSRNVDHPKDTGAAKSVNAFQLTSVSRPRAPPPSATTSGTTTTPASSKNVVPSSVSSKSSKIPVKKRPPPSSKTTVRPLDKKNQATSSCFPSLTTCFTNNSDPPTVDNAPTTTETGDHPLARGQNSALHPSPSVKPRKQRSAFTSSSVGTGKSSSNHLPHHSYDDLVRQKDKANGGKTRPTSVDRNWAPATPAGERPRTTVISRKSQGSSSTKKKLVVRGLQNYVNTHKRSSRPKLWDREFPIKSKYHPDNYIYEHEGPKCPPRPCSAMAKCRKHGGRCDVCGIFTCDLCQRCRKCELDCCCPKAPPCPNPASLYSEMFGDGWKKTCRVITDLTEKDKSNPVGGTANKRKQVCQTLNNQERGHCYQPHQIDVLNPCRTTCNDPCQPSQHQFPPAYAPFCPPPMMPYPMPSMTFMPVPMMPPPMPFYPPPPYDPYLCTSPYPPSDSFMPCQNY